MLDFEHLAIDGQKIQANANYKNSKNLKGLKKEYEKVKEGLTKLLDKEVNEYFTEDIKKQRESRLTEKLKKLESFQKELESLNDDEKRLNMVDCNAPVMAHKDGQKLPSYTHRWKIILQHLGSSSQGIDVWQRPKSMVNSINEIACRPEF